MSSDGAYARSKIRECDGLVEAILHIIRAAIGSNGMDNKSVENCVCILRNLSFACQEVQDKDYLKNRSKAARGGGAKGGWSHGLGLFPVGGVSAVEGGVSVLEGSVVVSALC